MALAVAPVPLVRSATKEAKACAAPWMGWVVSYRLYIPEAAKTEGEENLGYFNNLSSWSTRDADDIYRRKLSASAGLYRLSTPRSVGQMEPSDPLSLSQHIDRLLQWASERGPVPVFSDVRVFDAADPDVHWRADGRCSLPPAALHSVAAFSERFDAYLRAGYSWVNLCVDGLSEEVMVFHVEKPREPSGIPVGLTSVNYSGPRIDVSGWSPSMGREVDCCPRIWEAEIEIAGTLPTEQAPQPDAPSHGA